MTDVGEPSVLGVADDAKKASESTDVLIQLAQLQTENQCLRHQLEQQATLITKIQRQLQYATLLDQLTQLPNRRGFDRLLFQEWKRLARTQQPLSLLLVDIDSFQAYNRRYGRLAGDQCLFRVAYALRSGALRPADQVARYCGQQFAVLLPDTPLSGADYLAERLQQQISRLSIPHDRSAVAKFLTLSIGITSTVPKHNVLPTTLIEYADTALQEAKEQGRNRCSFQTF